MIGVDTNVLVRLCVRDNTDQVEAVLRLLSGAPPALVRVCVIMPAELTWTLLRRYRLDKATLIARLESLLSRVELDIEGRGAVMIALQWYRQGMRISRTTSSPHSIARLAPHQPARSTTGNIESSLCTGVLKATFTVRVAEQEDEHDGVTPDIEVDLETCEVQGDGELLTCATCRSAGVCTEVFLFDETRGS